VFDERHFCFVPKVGEGSSGDGDVREPPQLVLHVFNSTPSGQLPHLWHNRALHPLPATVAVECLFARFAWTVLSPHVFDEFLTSTPVPRRLLLWSGEKGEWEAAEASPEMCRKMWQNARSRLPGKRSAPRSSADAAEDRLAEEGFGLLDSGDFGADTSGNDGWYDDELGAAERSREKTRGRPWNR
jgi:hypothetical protein